MQFVDTKDGTRLAVQLIGPAYGAPLLVIPGGPCRDPAYLADLAGLGHVRPLAVLHPRGTPMSGGLSRGWWNDAADVIDVADHLGLDVFDVVAHSAGTRLALATAAQHPTRVRSLALITPAAAWLTGTAHDGPALARNRSEPEVAGALLSMESPPPEDESAFQRAWTAEAPAGYARWTAVEQQHSVLGGMNLAAATAWFRDIPDDVAARIVDGPLPRSLVLGGSGDLLSGVAPVRAYAAALSAELVLLERCGHYPWIEQPRAFSDVMRTWYDVHG